jgi:hypothetical protein
LVDAEDIGNVRTVIIGGKIVVRNGVGIGETPR